jgi:mono/diheme cytochrome c family protein
MRRPGVATILWLFVLSGCGPRVAGDAPSAAAGKPAAPVRAAVQSYEVREGGALFRHYCAPCHGDEGQGDGLNAYNLDPRPRDLADPAFRKSRSDDDLAAIIRSGGGAAGLSTAMPPWGRTLGERRIRNLVAYLRSLEPSAK